MNKCAIEVEEEVKRVYKLHQELHGKYNVHFDSVVKDVNLKYRVNDSIVYDIIREIR